MKKLGNFLNKNSEERYKLYYHLYVEKEQSWAMIAKSFGSYPNKVRRDAMSLGIKSRDRGDAQKTALKHGRSEHPTEGKPMAETSKILLSETMGEKWDNLTEQQRNTRSEKARQNWENRDESEKIKFQKACRKAINTSSKEGSKLELYLYEGLTEYGFQVSLHRKQNIANKRMHIDMFLPSFRAAIEIDGPSHYRVVYDEETFRKQQRADMEKNGLLINQGYVVVRIRHDHPNTQRYFRRQLDSLLNVMERIKQDRPRKPEDMLIRI